MIGEVASQIANLSRCRLRVAIDGRTAAGKTTFGDELGAALRHLGRSTMRTSFDDFKKTWSDAKEKGYDRISGEGYYRNAYDFESATELLLKPAGPEGSGRVVLCAHDPLTGIDHRNEFVTASDDAILIVDSVFAFRPEYNDYWDFRIWIEVSPQLALERGIARDAGAEGLEAATSVHRDRYRVAEEIYLEEVNPCALVDVRIDNTDFALPQIL